MKYNYQSNMKQIRRWSAFFGALLIAAQLSTSTAQAIDLQTSLNYGVLYYDKDYAGDCVTTNGISLSGNATAEKIFNFFTSTPISTNDGKPLNAIQASAFIGNFMQEAGPDLDTTKTNSIGAFGLAQWLGGRKDALSTLATRQGLQPTDLQAQLAYIKQEIEGGESAAVVDPAFKEGTDLSAITVVIRKKYERPGEAEAMDSKRIEFAQGIYEKYKGNAPAVNSSSTASSVGCKTAQVETGDIIKTALGLAWDKPVAEGKAMKADARQEYVDAIAQYGNIRNESDGIAPYSDCGRFVSTVMRMSGVDKEYPLVSVYDVQRKYVLAHPEKYLAIENPTMSNLQPGDIFMSTSHTAIYTGNPDFDTVDASLYGRVPGVSNNMSSYLTTQSQPLIVRVKG